MAEEVEVDLLAGKPALKKSHLWLMNSADAIFQTDCTTSYPTLTLGELLTLPVQTVINRHSIA